MKHITCKNRHVQHDLAVLFSNSMSLIQNIVVQPIIRRNLKIELLVQGLF